MQAHSLAISALNEMVDVHRDKQRRQEQAKTRFSKTGDHDFRSRLDAVLAADEIIKAEQEARAKLHLKYGPEAVHIADKIIQSSARRF